MNVPVVHVESLVLPTASSQWRGLLDTSLGAPPDVPVYTDPASLATATALNRWPAIHEVRTNERNAAADALVAANNGTAGALGSTDSGNGQSLQPLPPRTLTV